MSISNFIAGPKSADQKRDEACMFADLRENSNWLVDECSSPGQYVICERTTTDIVTGNCVYYILLSW